MPRITKRVVDAIRPDPTGRDVFVWDSGDGALKGFGIRMKPSGAGAYIVQYRTGEGRTRRLAIGKVGTLTPDEARIGHGRNLRRQPRGRTPPPSVTPHERRSLLPSCATCILPRASCASKRQRWQWIAAGSSAT